MSIQVNEFRYVQGENDAEYIKLLKEALDRQKKVTGKAIAKIKELSRRDWISCKDRLPTEDGDYFVTVDSRYIPPNCRNTDKFIWHDGKWVIVDYFGLDSDGWKEQYKIIEVDIPVLAWMPLSEGYVEDEQ